MGRQKVKEHPRRKCTNCRGTGRRDTTPYGSMFRTSMTCGTCRGSGYIGGKKL
jgi:DnaJ-class molecular chaperone